MTNQAIEAAAREIAGHVECPFTEKQIEAILRRHLSALSEPSDELPLVLGRVPRIASSASRGLYIYDLNDQLVQLRQSGEWANPSEEPFGTYYWPSYEAAVAFLRECAAQAASEPLANLPHPYFPDYEAMGDCAVCGQVESSSAHLPASEPAGERPSDPLAGRYWLLFFDDAERGSEVFTDEAAARQRFKECCVAWHCKLFVQASPAPAAPQAEPK